MKCNLGMIDRLARAIIGLAIAAAGAYYDNWWGLVAIVPLGTAYLGHCAIYRPFGWSTATRHK